MPKLPLVDGVLKYVRENKMSLSMPGHKGGLGFLQDLKGKELYDNLIKCDITEVDGVDNLHNPKGIILEAQELLREYYHSKKSYFLINGSTSGNLAMIFSAFNEGEKILIERNCHISILNAVVLRKLRPIYIQNAINEKYDAPMCINEYSFISALDENKDAKGVIITYPNYYGICINLKFIVEQCKLKGIKLIVDSAHGAHFSASKKLPESAVDLGADMVVMSAHKTLPSINQASFLHVNDETLVKKANYYVSVFSTTSPSYMMMCSMDYARYYLQEYGEQAYTDLVELANKYRIFINELPHFYVISSSDMNTIDLTRYVLNVEKGYDASRVYNFLRNNGVQPEMCDGRNIILIFSPFNSEGDFKRIYSILSRCPIEDYIIDYKKIYLCDIPEKVLEPYEVLDKNGLWVKIEDCIGKICGEAVVPYPPGVPLISIGERVDKALVDMILYYMSIEINISGFNQGKIFVLEEDDENRFTSVI